MMIYSKKMYGESRLKILCNYDEVNSIVTKVIDNMANSFSASHLYTELVKELDKCNHFEKEKNTTYDRIKFYYDDELTINAIIWDMIINKKLMINLFVKDEIQF